MKKVVHSSESIEWYTPRDLYKRLHDEFSFELDVCARPGANLCEKFYSKNSISEEWNGSCWMNPPYGSGIGAWMKKAYETALSGKGTVVCLIPSRTDTAWWHNYVLKATEVRFIRGRLKLGNVKTNAPFPSVVVIFKSGCVSETCGTVRCIRVQTKYTVMRFRNGQWS